jgi:AcrR family transcriptional regulator
MKPMTLEEVRAVFAAGVAGEAWAGDPSAASVTPRDRKRRRIIEAGTSLFIRHGYRKASMDDVAREAGVAKGTLYLYFRAKRDLLIAAVAEEKRRSAARIEPLLDASLAARRRLREYVRLAFVLASEMPLTARLMSGDREVLLALDEFDPAAVRGMQELQESILGAFVAPVLEGRAAADRAELGERCRVLLAVLYAVGTILDERVRRDLPVARFAEVVSAMLVNGIAAAGPRAGRPAGSPRGRAARGKGGGA